MLADTKPLSRLVTYKTQGQQGQHRLHGIAIKNSKQAQWLKHYISKYDIKSAVSFQSFTMGLWRLVIAQHQLCTAYYQLLSNSETSISQYLVVGINVFQQSLLHTICRSLVRPPHSLKIQAIELCGVTATKKLRVLWCLQSLYVAACNSRSLGFWRNISEQSMFIFYG